MERLANIIDVLKSPKLSACMVIAGTILLFVPEFRQQYVAFGIVAVVLGSAMLTVEFIWWVLLASLNGAVSVYSSGTSWSASRGWT